MLSGGSVRRAAWGAGEPVDPNWDDVVLLLPFDGTDGDTETVDESKSHHDMTFAGAAEIDTAEAKFGPSSLYTTDTNTSQVTAPDSDDFNFGGGDWTVEFHMNPTLASNIGVIIGQYDSGQRSWAIWQQNSGIIVYRSTNGSAQTTSISVVDIVADEWTHIAVCHDSVDGITIFFDGVEDTGVSNTGALTLHNSTGKLRIGNYNSDAGSSFGFNGNLDEIRVTKGVVRYTENFTPPSAPYPIGDAPYPLSVDISPNSIFDFNPNCPLTSQSVTGTGAGGAGGYSYAWDWSVGGSGLTINSPTSQSTTITTSSSGSKTGTLRCTVTDDDTDTAVDTISVNMECGTA